jgi:hypothetical protein
MKTSISGHGTEYPLRDSQNYLVDRLEKLINDCGQAACIGSGGYAMQDVEPQTCPAEHSIHGMCVMNQSNSPLISNSDGATE